LLKIRDVQATLLKHCWKNRKKDTHCWPVSRKDMMKSMEPRAGLMKWRGGGMAKGMAKGWQRGR